MPGVLASLDLTGNGGLLRFRRLLVTVEKNVLRHVQNVLVEIIDEVRCVLPRRQLLLLTNSNTISVSVSVFLVIHPL